MSTTANPSAGPAMPAPSAEHQATQKVAERFVELVSAGRNLDAIKELYADNVRHLEPMEGPGYPRITEGKAAVTKKAEQFARITTVHGATCGKPIVNGDQFICAMSLDCTCSEGPFANQRMNLQETSLYTVRNGKITEARFFYGCG
ncbi:MAG: nuclear transport factor 2 family protein [Phycisphaerales bacterium]